MSYWRLLIGSFFNPEAYRQMREVRQGWGLVYALMVVGITTLAGMVWLVSYFHTAVMVERDGQPPLLQEMMVQIATQWPEMVIANNEMTVTGPTAMPYKIHVRGEIFGEQFEGDFITIDTTGATTHLNMTTPILITRDEIISKEKDGKKELRSIGDMVKADHQPMRVDQAKILELSNDMFVTLKKVIWIFYALFVPILWGILTALFFIGRVVLLLMLGVLTLALGNTGNGRMRYMEAVRLSSLAYTPVAVLTAIGFALALSTPSTLVLVALGALMVFVALYVTRRETTA